MYEVGKKRPDGKFNIWGKERIKESHWEWVIVEVLDDAKEAKAFVDEMNGKRK